MDGEKNTSTKSTKVAIFSLIIVIVLLIILILILYLLKSPLLYRSSAYSDTTTVISVPTTTEVSSSISTDNSYIFASPLTAMTGGESIRITVYVLDNRGLGVSGQKVSLGNPGALTVNAVQPVTDGQGRAVFDISSVKTGAYIIQASVAGTSLPQEANVTFD